MKAKARMKTLRRLNWFDYLNYFIMFLIVVVMLYPLYYCAIVSISDGAAVVRGDVFWKPIGFDTRAYEVVFGNKQILGAYGNTIYYTALGTFINIVMTALCAYPLSRPHLKGRKAFNFLFMLTMFISGGMIPMYLQIKALNMINTTWAIVLPGAISTYNMIIMRTFFSSIPEELHEAAQIDGASQIQTFLTVILPLSQTIMATLVLFYAVAHWNGFMSALLYLEDQDRMPLQIIIRKMVIDSDLASMTTANSSSSSTETLLSENKIKYAIVMISVLPMVVVYPFLQKYFVKGVMIGAVKG
jgi:putative aldouronate transport system permease protein